MFELIPLEEKYLDLILGWRNHPDVRKSMYNEHIISKEEHRNWYATIKDDPSCQYFIFVKDNGPAGVISFTYIDVKNKTSSWAFYSGDTSKRGIGPLMEITALDYAFRKLKLEKLWCEVLEFNESVIRFHKKFGFQEEGIFKGHYLRDGERYDIHRLAIFKDQWLDTRLNFLNKFNLLEEK